MSCARLCCILAFHTTLNHTQAALQKADADFQLTKLNWQQCETERKQQTADATTAAKAAEGAAKQLQQELDSTRTALKEATGKLQHAQQELSTVKQQQQDNKQQADKQQQDTPAQTELETARQSLKAATEKLKGAQGELSAAQQQQYQQHHLLHAQIEVLQQQLREEQGQHSQWMEQQHKLQQEKDQLLKEKQELMQVSGEEVGREWGVQEAHVVQHWGMLCHAVMRCAVVCYSMRILLFNAAGPSKGARGRISCKPTSGSSCPAAGSSNNYSSRRQHQHQHTSNPQRHTHCYGDVFGC